MKKYWLLLVSTAFFYKMTTAQDTSVYQLRVSLPLIDLPQNISLKHRAPSMNQALEISSDFYEFGFWGIDKLGGKLFIPKTKAMSKGRKFSNAAFKYAVGFAFSKYGSELPLPFGVWAHEEFHRSVLGVNNIASKNGNWIFSRWDGTVFGVSDLELSDLKRNKPDQLLYAYVAGVQYEIALNQKTTLGDFYKKRSLAKNALLLYNALYVYDYFKFSTSNLSDSVKVIAPRYEDKNPVQRDFAGADLTAWVYDMFNPGQPYTVRDSFPNGEGINRRVGFHDLSTEARDYLIQQKKLSLLNFLNPAIFFINRIRLNKNLSFNLFAQYSPTHFGNDVAVFLPVKYRAVDFLLDIHNYSSRSESGIGVGLGLYHFRLAENIESDVKLNVWNQPESFYGSKKVTGGMAGITTRFLFRPDFSAFVSLSAKTKGWVMSNPYLDNNISIQLGFNYNLAKK